MPVAGSLAQSGKSLPFPAPQGQPFKVTVGALPSGDPTATTGPWSLLVSMDGTDFAPANPLICSIPNPKVFSGPISFDVNEQLAGAVYALFLGGNPGAAVPYRFDP